MGLPGARGGGPSVPVAAGLSFDTFPTPIGALTVVASADGIVATLGGDGDLDAHLDRVGERHGAEPVHQPARLRGAGEDLKAYFSRERRSLATPVDLGWAGDGFFRRAWLAAMDVPYGELMTYGDLAAAARSPRAARAAGHAMASCPIEIWIPCHRIVPAGPGLGAYGGAEARRAFLLRLEGAI